jgi:SAM-dependent methyltransferase
MSSLEKTYRDYRQSTGKRRSWAADNPGNVAIRAELFTNILDLAAAQLDGNGKILDVGCGGGWLLDRLASHGVAQKRLHGVDLLSERVDAARRRLPAADIRLADARGLPFPDDEFQLVTLLTCLSSMPDRESVSQALAEARRVLASGGLLLCYEPRLSNPLNRATRRVTADMLRDTLGQETYSRHLTGLPPFARRLGPLTPRFYPLLSRIAPTHALKGWEYEGGALALLASAPCTAEGPTQMP